MSKELIDDGLIKWIENNTYINQVDALNSVLGCMMMYEIMPDILDSITNEKNA